MFFCVIKNIFPLWFLFYYCGVNLLQNWEGCWKTVHSGSNYQISLWSLTRFTALKIIYRWWSPPFSYCLRSEIKYFLQRKRSSSILHLMISSCSTCISSTFFSSCTDQCDKESDLLMLIHKHEKSALYLQFNKDECSQLQRSNCFSSGTLVSSYSPKIRCLLASLLIPKYPWGWN